MGIKVKVPPSPQLEPAPDYPHPKRLEWYRKLYSTYHEQHEKLLAGKVSPEHVKGISRVIARWREQTRKPHPRLLDYGSGKGYQYLCNRIHEKWGGILPVCYDPGVFHLARRPEGRFDGIICTDILEHIDEEDVSDILNDMKLYLGKNRPAFIYANICCRPAWKTFEDGSNLHKTVQTPDWWEQKINAVFGQDRGIKFHRSYVVEIDEEDDGQGDVPDCPGDAPASGGHALPEGPASESPVSGSGVVPAQED